MFQLTRQQWQLLKKTLEREVKVHPELRVIADTVALKSDEVTRLWAEETATKAIARVKEIDERHRRAAENCERIE